MTLFCCGPHTYEQRLKTWDFVGEEDPLLSFTIRNDLDPTGTTVVVGRVCAITRETVDLYHPSKCQIKRDNDYPVLHLDSGVQVWTNEILGVEDLSDFTQVGGERL